MQSWEPDADLGASQLVCSEEVLITGSISVESRWPLEVGQPELASQTHMMVKEVGKKLFSRETTTKVLGDSQWWFLLPMKLSCHSVERKIPE